MRRIKESLDATLQSKAYTSLMSTLPQESQALMMDAVKGLYGSLEKLGFKVTTPERRSKVTKSVAKGGIYGYQNNAMSQLTWHEILSIPFTSNEDWRATTDAIKAGINDVATSVGGTSAGYAMFLKDMSLELTWNDRPHLRYTEDGGKMVNWEVMLKMIVPAIKVVAEEDKPEHNIDKHKSLIASLQKSLSKIASKDAVDKAINAVEDIYAMIDGDYTDAMRVSHRQKEVAFKDENLHKKVVTADVFSWQIAMLDDNHSPWDYMERFNFLDSDYASTEISGFYKPSYIMGDDLFLNLDYNHKGRDTWKIAITLVKLNDNNRFKGIQNDFASRDNLSLGNSHVYLSYSPEHDSLSGSEVSDEPYWNQYRYYTTRNAKTAKAWEGLLGFFDADTTESDLFHYLLDNYHILLHLYLPD